MNPVHETCICMRHPAFMRPAGRTERTTRMERGPGNTAVEHAVLLGHHDGMGFFHSKSQKVGAAQMPEDSRDKASAIAEQYAGALKMEYGALETAMSISLTESGSPAPEQVLSSDSASKLLTLLLTLPHGVIKYSHTVPGTKACLQGSPCLTTITLSTIETRTRMPSSLGRCRFTHQFYAHSVYLEAPVIPALSTLTSRSLQAAYGASGMRALRLEVLIG